MIGRVGPLNAALAALVLLTGCGPRDGSDLPQADAAHWMDAACGIRFAAAPKVIRSTVVASRAPSGAPASVVLTVVLPDGEADAAVAALARNRTLHRRGQSETRYSYESFPDVRPEKECELDRSQHVLYLRYVP
jgi:hypothetical protein